MKFWQKEKWVCDIISELQYKVEVYDSKGVCVGSRKFSTMEVAKEYCNKVKAKNLKPKLLVKKDKENGSILFRTF